MTDVKPCPFCGNQGHVERFMLSPERWHCYCGDCGSCGPAGHTEQEALASWGATFAHAAGREAGLREAEATEDAELGRHIRRLFAANPATEYCGCDVVLSESEPGYFEVELCRQKGCYAARKGSGQSLLEAIGKLREDSDG